MVTPDCSRGGCCPSNACRSSGTNKRWGRFWHLSVVATTLFSRSRCLINWTSRDKARSRSRRESRAMSAHPHDRRMGGAASRGRSGLRCRRRRRTPDVEPDLPDHVPDGDDDRRGEDCHDAPATRRATQDASEQAQVSGKAAARGGLSCA